MINSLIDNLNLNARDLAIRWKDKIRQIPHLTNYNNLDDETLIESMLSLFPLVARTLDRGLDRSLVGGTFVNLGKEQMHKSFPISEVIYGINIVQQTIIEYIMSDFIFDNPLQMYAAMGMIMKISELFLLGCFYLTKGFLEATYTSLNSTEAVSEDILKKYFRDDFFFKRN
ncbi:MAG: hypothetical protein LBQ77_07675 [Treponema sp.]|jgi:hypothetical protein|nr:hypothetical protein [Treponema sp.]